MAIPTTGAIFIAAILIECYSRYVRALISQRATRYEPVNQMGETFVTITEGTSGGRYSLAKRNSIPELDTFPRR